MSGHLKKSIQELADKLRGQEAEVLETKKAINLLHKMIGQPEPYKRDEPDAAGIATIRADSFFGKGLATAVGDYLEMRGHAATVAEIMSGLQQGGYDFGDAKFPERVLRINIAKNTYKFVSIKGSDSFGLRKWYPNIKNESKGKSGSGRQPDDTEIEVAEREEQDFNEDQGSDSDDNDTN